MSPSETSGKAFPPDNVLQLVKEIITQLVCGIRKHLGMQINDPVQIRCRHGRQPVVVEIDVDDPFYRESRRQKVVHPQVGEISLASPTHALDDRRIVTDHRETPRTRNGIRRNAIRIKL